MSVIVHVIKAKGVPIVILESYCLLVMLLEETNQLEVYSLFASRDTRAKGIPRSGIVIVHTTNAKMRFLVNVCLLVPLISNSLQRVERYDCEGQTQFD